MAATKINFTKAALQKIEPPHKPEGAKGGVSDTYHDLGEKGLILIVSHGGAKTFYLYMKINGVPKRIKIGAFPDLSIEQARKQAQSLKGQIAHGDDPTDTAKQQKEEYTLKLFFYDVYIEQYAKKHNRSWQNTVKNFERYLSDIANLKLSDINSTKIRALHQQLGQSKGIYTANRTYALIHVIFNKAIEYGWNGSNPAHGIKKFKEKSRERFLQPDELPRFMEALEAEPNHDMRDYFKMLLLTGARRSNVASMHWKDISLELATWTIQDTKNGESHMVNLPDLAVQILQGRAIAQQKSGWIFPSATSASGHLEEPKSAWKRIVQRAGIENVRIHDLRRTLGSYQAITGASGFIIGKSLGHKSSSATAIYARLNADPVRQSVERATAMIFDIGNA
jgi:integrase